MTNCDVIIIGAGVAGMAAAHDLVKAGITNILILEAQERIGGRTHTVNNQNLKFLSY
jgi:monoamine oxidase